MTPICCRNLCGGEIKPFERKQKAYLDVFGRFTFSVITVAEFVDRARRQGRDDRIAGLISDIEAGKHEVISLGLKAAEIAGYIFGDLHRIGQPIGGADPFIAAIALAETLPLITGNIEHYERIQSLGYPLQLENWRRP